MIKCINCEHENKETSIFCGNCGTKFNKLLDEDSKNEGTTQQYENEEPIEVLAELVANIENLDNLSNSETHILDIEENNNFQTLEPEIKYSSIKKDNSKVLSFIKNLSVKRKFLFVLIIIFTLLGIGSLSYANVTKPSRLQNEIALGNKYLQEGNYEPAVLAFLKAIKIDSKSINARIGLANAYIKLNKLEEAEKALLDAIKIAPMNVDVILLLSDIWKDKNIIDLYTLLDEYVKKAAPPNEKIKKLYDEMIAPPSLPKASLPSGKYTEEISINLSTNNITPGTSIYYTLDGSVPSKDSTLYSKPIKINNGQTILKCLCINIIDISGGKIAFEYLVDINYKDKLKDLIALAQTSYKSSEEGSTPGKYEQGSKVILLLSINSAKALVDKTSATQDNITKAYDSLNKTLSEFKEKLIPTTNKANLINTIDEVQKILNNSQEGSSVGQYPSGSKSVLQNVLNNSIKINADIMANQIIVDSTNSALRNALNNFVASSIKDLIEQEMNSRLDEAGAKGGQIRISLMWNNSDDLDLHCITPAGEEIYYGRESDSKGGLLDVDANAGNVTITPVENIVWSTAPLGTYKISVKCFSKRDTDSTPFTVFVSINNSIKKFTGSLSTSGETKNIYEFKFNN